MINLLFYLLQEEYFTIYIFYIFYEFSFFFYDFLKSYEFLNDEIKYIYYILTFFCCHNINNIIFIVDLW